MNPEVTAKVNSKLEDSFRRGVVIENVFPKIDCGRFPIKRTIGDEIEVTADIFCAGHDALSAVLSYKPSESSNWYEVPMEPVGNDLYRGAFIVSQLGVYHYTVTAWVDRYESWLQDVEKKHQAGQETASEFEEGALLIQEVAEQASGRDAAFLKKEANRLNSSEPQAAKVQAVRDLELRSKMHQFGSRAGATSYGHALSVNVERELASFGAWYEMFPRSTAGTDGKHGTFKDCEKVLPYVASMGFDVLYLPPVHPIGLNYRKGPNNKLKAGSNDPGSPWAIGSAEGGHKSLHPQLGTMAEFDQFVDHSRKLGLELALDIAFQCSPDHPYVKQHPEWFRHRPDGTIKYAENPPKKYQDIYPLDFECREWESLWTELKDVVLFWISHGVHVFRVDNPHTKTFRFWEWLISEVKKIHPNTIFLAEAFTRPKVMRYLAKSGFSQSYTYFTWRNTKSELIEYFTELTTQEVKEYLRPNLFVNTPDILHEYLQFGGRAAFQIRLVLAATLSATYGIYGPPFELCENRAIPGTEEYLDSEKYQIRFWNRDDQKSLAGYISKLNQIRKKNPALHRDRSLRFHLVDNDQILCYSKNSPNSSNLILVVVNLDPHHTQQGEVTLPIQEWNLKEKSSFKVVDQITGNTYLWQGATNSIKLDPETSPAYVLEVKLELKTEKDFDYFY